MGTRLYSGLIVGSGPIPALSCTIPLQRSRRPNQGTKDGGSSAAKGPMNQGHLRGAHGAGTPGLPANLGSDMSDPIVGEPTGHDMLEMDIG